MFFWPYAARPERQHQTIGDGFNVSWTTITKRADGRKRKKSYSIDFSTSKRDGIYSSAMRRDMFGNRRPIDPLAGGVPFVWATLKGATLTVHALLITDDGGYELQSYRRTLVEKGLRLEFRRFRTARKCGRYPASSSGRNSLAAGRRAGVSAARDQALIIAFGST